ncbi:MAG TPA: allantoate amidohydrolase [Terriglobales bacterium]|nr:allantoate amidohydrolase [Terriglobales bacterium]
MQHRAQEVINLCRKLAEFTEEPGHTTRTFLSPPMRDVHHELASRMEQLGMSVTTDAAGNLRGFYPARTPGARRVIIGSHLDTVPHAGAFDGILGVVMGIAMVDALTSLRMPFGIEVVGFSEEEGVRFGVPFIGSRALVGTLDEPLLDVLDSHGLSVADAIRSFGLDPARLPEARLADNTLGYLEVHIEQGPILESLNYPLGVVETIVGQSRLIVSFTGKSSHAGTTSMDLRRDALAAAARWITSVESIAQSTSGLVATVGRLEIEPNARNVIAGSVHASLDVRHAQDTIRHQAVDRMLKEARQIAADRGLKFEEQKQLDQPAVAMDATLVKRLSQAVKAAGYPVHHMSSGAGHDAMILAAKIPAAMLFLRSPGGISHHPDENVLVEDVTAALNAGMHFLEQWESHLD